MSGNKTVTHASQYKNWHLFIEVSLPSKHIDAVPQNYIHMYWTFHTGSPWRRHWCPDHRHPSGLAGHSWLWRHRHLPYNFHPSQLSLSSTIDKVVARVNAFTSLWVIPVSQPQNRMSQPLARTATIEPYSILPSRSVSSEEFLKIQWPGSRRKLRFRPLSGPCGSRPAVKEGLTNVRRLFDSTAPTSFTLLGRPVSNEHFQRERFTFIRLLLLSHQCCVPLWIVWKS